MRYMRRLGSGRAVSVFVSDKPLDLNNLVLKFERKIEAGDVENGRLLPVSTTEVKRRGAKRVTSIALSYETAEALHKVLGTALRDARKRQIHHQFSNQIMSMLFESERYLEKTG